MWSTMYWEHCELETIWNYCSNTLFNTQLYLQGRHLATITTTQPQDAICNMGIVEHLSMRLHVPSRTILTATFHQSQTSSMMKKFLCSCPPIRYWTHLKTIYTFISTSGKVNMISLHHSLSNRGTPKEITPLWHLSLCNAHLFNITCC